MTTLDPHLRPALPSQVRLQNDPVTGDPVVLYPEGVLVLNETAREIVSRCDGVSDVATIIKALAVEYDAGSDELSSDVVECLQRLVERNLILLK